METPLRSHRIRPDTARPGSGGGRRWSAHIVVSHPLTLCGISFGYPDRNWSGYTTASQAAQDSRETNSRRGRNLLHPFETAEGGGQVSRVGSGGHYHLNMPGEQAFV